MSKDDATAKPKTDTPPKKPAPLSREHSWAQQRMKSGGQIKVLMSTGAVLTGVLQWWDTYFFKIATDSGKYMVHKSTVVWLRAVTGENEQE